jgi:hypothetical protein
MISYLASNLYDFRVVSLGERRELSPAAANMHEYPPTHTTGSNLRLNDIVTTWTPLKLLA